MNPKCFTPENENPPCPPFSKGGIKVPLWKRGIYTKLRSYR
jgi:hypothetical protein